MRSNPSPFWQLLWNYVRGFVIIGVFCELGFAVVALLRLPFPPPLIGLAALALGIRFRLVRIEWIEVAGAFLMRHMSLFFLPILLGAAQFLKGDVKTLAVLGLTLIGGSLITLL